MQTWIAIITYTGIDARLQSKLLEKTQQQKQELHIISVMTHDFECMHLFLYVSLCTSIIV